MRVLSLFDGISCARVALDRAGLPVSAYLASEIDPHAIAVSQANYPDIVRLGDVREITQVGPVDLLIGGSPCQDLSVAKKNRQGLAGSRSSLFWEYVRIRDLVRPTWFVLENVASMSKADRDTITATLGVEPILIDAALVSAQSRKRLFWTNLPVGQPEDRGILLRDILEAEVDASYTIDGKSFTPTQSKAEAGRKKQSFVQVGFFGPKNHCGVGGQALRVYDVEGKSTTSGVGLYKVGHIGATNGQANRVYDPNGKSATLSANGGGLGAKTGLYAIRDRIRKLTPVECERLQGLPDGYTEGISKTQRYRCLGNAFNVDVVAHILSSLRGEQQEHA